MLRAFSAARGTSRKNPAGRGRGKMALEREMCPASTWILSSSYLRHPNRVWSYQIVDSGTTLPLPSPAAYWKPVAHLKSWRPGVRNLCFQHEKVLIRIDFFFDISLAPSVGMKLCRLKVKILIVRELLDDIVWNMVNTLPSIKGSDSAFFHNFLDFFFEGPPCFQGQFHRHFLKNVSWDYKDENWPRASLNLFGIIFACFPIIFFGGLWLSTTVVTTEFGTARFVALIPQLSPLQAFRKYVNLSVIFIVSYLTFPRVHLSRLGNPLFVISHSGIEEYTCRV